MRSCPDTDTDPNNLMHRSTTVTLNNNKLTLNNYNMTLHDLYIKLMVRDHINLQHSHILNKQNQHVVVKG